MTDSFPDLDRGPSFLQLALVLLVVATGVNLVVKTGELLGWW